MPFISRKRLRELEQAAYERGNRDAQPIILDPAKTQTIQSQSPLKNLYDLMKASEAGLIDTRLSNDPANVNSNVQQAEEHPASLSTHGTNH